MKSAFASPIVLAKNEAGQLTDSTEGYLHLVWAPGTVKGELRRALLDRLATGLQTQKLRKALIDQRVMTPYSPAEQQWINEVWMPKAVEAGYRYRAILQANDVFARLATASFTNSWYAEVTHQFFTDEAAARAWLLAQ